MRGADETAHPPPGGEEGRQPRGVQPGMARWRWYLYRLLARFEASEAEYYDLPPDRRTEVGPPRKS